MTQKSYNKKSVFNLNDKFEEEVPANELEDRKDPEIVYKKSVDIFILIVFFLMLGLLLWSIYYAYNGVRKNINLIEKSGDLAVIHSKIDYGLTIVSFSDYTSLENASEYSFYIESDNTEKLSYKIKIKKQKFTNTIDMNEVNYVLYRNNLKVASGSLSDLKNDVLTEESISANSKNQYLLKLWSIKGINKGYKYKIEVNSL